jgi:glycosyltransferase involved in cell wall biosynthesis
VDAPLVSIGLPVRNGARTLEPAIRSVLDQDHHQLELVICDNASNDDTEEICRTFARADRRVRYRRQPHNVGLVNNFVHALGLAQGDYFKWMGDDDYLTPRYVSRCVDVLEDDDRLILVTTQQAYVATDGTQQSRRYDADVLGGHRAVDRFQEMLRLMNAGHLLLDPLYGLMRRERILHIRRVNMLHEDEIYAARLALAGPFGHVPEVLSYRGFKPFSRRPQVANKLGIPSWHASVATLLQCRELLKAVDEVVLEPEERRLARAAVARMYVHRHRVTAVHRSRRLSTMVASRVSPRPPPPSTSSGRGAGAPAPPS